MLTTSMLDDIIEIAGQNNNDDPLNTTWVELYHMLRKWKTTDLQYLQAVMYLGRDGCQDTETSPYELLERERRYIDLFAWSKKEPEVQKMLRPDLAECLQKGRSIVGI